MNFGNGMINKCIAVIIVIIIICSSCSENNIHSEDVVSREGSLVSNNSSDNSESQDSSVYFSSNGSNVEISQSNPESSVSSISSESISESSQKQTDSVNSLESSSVSQSAVPSSVSSNVSSVSFPGESSGERDNFNNSETRAVWISYLEYCNILTGKSEKSFTSSISDIFSKLSESGFNTVYVHARSHCDAYYSSDIFPWSVYITGTESNDPGFDPLKIMIRVAHSYGLSIEAWINPYRIKGNSNTSKISASSPAYDWIGTDKIIVLDNGIFFNPADEDVIDLIVDGVEEIVSNYDVDGIHFDDYFYPSTDINIDLSYYYAYKNKGGSLDRDEWRRDNVNKLIKKVYAAIKNLNPSCRFGISPSGNINQDYNDLYCDLYTWTSKSGYIDYLCPQLYYGFENRTQPYQKVLDDFNNMISINSIDLIIGLSAYKIGIKDTYAGTGSNEWIDHNDILSRQIVSARKETNYKGFALYRYDSIYNPESSVKKAVSYELEKLYEII